MEAKTKKQEKGKGRGVVLRRSTAYLSELNRDLEMEN